MHQLLLGDQYKLHNKIMLNQFQIRLINESFTTEYFSVSSSIGRELIYQIK
jgi:hypothetical protein